MSLYRTIKTFDNYPCSHRQWRHPGHCKFIHGYSRSFTITFGCTELTESGFGVDFGEFAEVKAWLSHWFDHTLLINADDPERELFESLHAKSLSTCAYYPTSVWSVQPNSCLRLSIHGFANTPISEPSCWKLNAAKTTKTPDVMCLLTLSTTADNGRSSPYQSDQHWPAWQ